MHVTHARAAILSVGDELTLGQTLNTNSRWLAERLASLGILTVEHTTVPDDQAAQSAAIRRLATCVDLVIVTGGLGPTADDLTRHALADAMDDALIEDPLALAQVESWFAASGREMPLINRVQALRPRSAASLSNLNGTAPGLYAAFTTGDNSSSIFCLPGPPREMMPMFEAQVLPRLAPPSGRTVRTRVLHCFGIGESDLATRLGPLMDRTRTPLVGTTASAGVVSCRIRYEGELSAEEADQALDDTERQVRGAAGDFIFGSGAQSLAEVVLTLLKERHQRLAVVESCTGGLLGALITDTSGASSAFEGGLVTYSNQLKQDLVGVDPKLLEQHGAVSSEVAQAMAVGGLKRLNADHCLAITGIAGPDGAVVASQTRPAKPVGTVYIARASKTGQGLSTESRHFRFFSDRHSIRDWSAKSALAMLRFHLLNLGHVRLLRQTDA